VARTLCSCRQHRSRRRRTIRRRSCFSRRRNPGDPQSRTADDDRNDTRPMTRPRNETTGMPSQRQLRVGELVRKELSDILTRGGFSNPDLDGAIITVPEVRMSPDLRLATCLVMPLGGRNADKVVRAMNRSTKYFRGQVSRRLTMKFMPDLRFVLDTRFDDDDRIDRLLHTPEVQRDLSDEDGADQSDTDDANR